MVTPRGNGKVVDSIPLKGAVLVELEQGGQHEFLVQELQPLEELEALKNKADSSCENCPEDTQSAVKKGNMKPHGRPR